MSDGRPDRRFGAVFEYASALAVPTLAVIYKSFQAATADPVHSLKYE